MASGSRLACCPWRDLAKYAASGQLAGWQQLVSRVGELLAAFFERHAEVVAPPALLGGRDLLALGMTQGQSWGSSWPPWPRRRRWGRSAIARRPWPGSPAD